MFLTAQSNSLVPFLVYSCSPFSPSSPRSFLSVTVLTPGVLALAHCLVTQVPAQIFELCLLTLDDMVLCSYVLHSSQSWWVYLSSGSPQNKGPKQTQLCANSLVGGANPGKKGSVDGIGVRDGEHTMLLYSAGDLIPRNCCW